MSDQTDLLQGTLDLLIMRTIALEPMHGWAIAQRIQQMSDELLRVQQGSLYPALHRLEHQGWITAEWGASENNRRAKFYSLTRAGRKQLDTEPTKWERLSAGVNLVLPRQLASCASGTSLLMRLRSLLLRRRARARPGRGAAACTSTLETERLQAAGLLRDAARRQALRDVRRRRAGQGDLPRRPRHDAAWTRSCATSARRAPSGARLAVHRRGRADPGPRHRRQRRRSSAW